MDEIANIIITKSNRFVPNGYLERLFPFERASHIRDRVSVIVVERERRERERFWAR